MFTIKNFKGIQYLTTKPSIGKESEKCPAIIFMHGAGTRGEDIEKLKTNPFYECAMPYLGECITFAPLCHTDSWFDMFEHILDFCEFVSNHESVDKNRVYLMGSSMGGYAVWQMAMSKPELFAGIIPICGGGMYWNALRLKNVPVWAFHGEDDDCVFPEESIRMVDNINANGGDAKLTLYPNTGHDAWSATYQNKEVFDWLFSQVKHEQENLYTNFDDVKIYG